MEGRKRERMEPSPSQKGKTNNYANWSIGLQSTFNPPGHHSSQSTPISEIAHVGVDACGRKLQRGTACACTALAAIIKDAHALLFD
ncbi:hypothetical protein X777_15390 [Ooceraea biroi]|uniref:Uncharacterized protein n=1 Tax=Ooceraea biroi TaxID=2015173 RepID=A0A026VV85_OOCBI|nr:hypothetical protein X777_15390 [Ooceraea biroi]